MVRVFQIIKTIRIFFIIDRNVLINYYSYLLYGFIMYYYVALFYLFV